MLTQSRPAEIEHTDDKATAAFRNPQVPDTSTKQRAKRGSSKEDNYGDTPFRDPQVSGAPPNGKRKRIQQENYEDTDASSEHEAPVPSPKRKHKRVRQEQYEDTDASSLPTAKHTRQQHEADAFDPRKTMRQASKLSINSKKSNGERKQRVASDRS